MRAALRRRQPSHEVGQPCVGGGLELRVLVQEVVELPGLVADPQVVRLGFDHVVKDHEVGEQDLIHPADRLEHIELVVVALRADVT